MWRNANLRNANLKSTIMCKVSLKEAETNTSVKDKLNDSVLKVH